MKIFDHYRLKSNTNKQITYYSDVDIPWIFSIYKLHKCKQLNYFIDGLAFDQQNDKVYIQDIEYDITLIPIACSGVI